MILKVKEQAEKNKKEETLHSLRILKESLETINVLHNLVEDLKKDNSKLRLDNVKCYRENAEFKNLLNIGKKMICQVSLSKIIGAPELHHIRYPMEWADDSIDNIIMVSRGSHQWIHDNLLKRDYDTKEQALNHIQFEYFKQNDARAELSRVKSKVVNLMIDLKEF